MTSNRAVRRALVAALLAVTGCANATVSEVGSGTAVGIKVEVTPRQEVVPPLGERTFSATVTGTSDGRVTWRLLESAGGRLDDAGRYIAGTSPGTYRITATSVIDSDAVGEAGVTVKPPIVTEVVPLDRQTLWQPGVSHNGGLPNRTAVFRTLSPSGGDDTRQINEAIAACPANQVVQLGPGTFNVGTIWLQRSNVTLRGSGRSGPGRTVLRGLPTSVLVFMGANASSFTAPTAVTVPVAKGARSITVASTAGLAVGDLIVIDQSDDPSYLVTNMNRPYFKRGPGYTDWGPASTTYRSMGQTTQITAIAGGVISIATPIHQRFDLAFSPQVWKSRSVSVRHSGVENLVLTGSTNTTIMLQDAAYCWVKNVETDGSVVGGSNTTDPGGTFTGAGISGLHVQVQRGFRNEIRDSWLHDAPNIIHGGGAYGLCLQAYTSETLVENNVVQRLNKPISVRVGGGGNVVAYNYVDDAMDLADGRFQETGIDFGHSSFPHHDLYEGNWAPQIAADNVWGNSGWSVAFRNWATGIQHRTPTAEPKTGCFQVSAVGVQSRAVFHSFVGNVLGMPGQGQLYEVHGRGGTGAMSGNGNNWAIWRIGNGINNGSTGNGTYLSDGWDPYPWSTSSTLTLATDPGNAGATLVRHGNFDYVTNTVIWDPTIADRALPPSLYLLGKPAFFGDLEWPWVDPLGAVKTHVLPAKQRHDAGTP